MCIYECGNVSSIAVVQNGDGRYVTHWTTNHFMQVFSCKRKEIFLNE